MKAYRLPAASVFSVLLLAASASGPARAEVGWYAQSSPVTTQLNGVDFVDADHGWICGNGGVVLATVDGGQHWNLQTSGVSAHLLDIAFTDTQAGFAVGQYGVAVRTTNGGSTWTVEGVPDPSIQSLGVDAQGQNLWRTGYYMEGYAVGSVSWSTDAGSSWDGEGFQCYEGPPHYYCGYEFHDISVVSPQVAYISGVTRRYDGGTYGLLLRTTDGGSTFEWKNGVLDWGEKLDFPTASVGYLLSFGLNKTTDGGETWAGHSTGISEAALSFLDAQHGWVVGYAGGIARTTDGAATWSVQTSGTTASLVAVDFVNSSVGAAVGANGTILHTVTGGESGTGVAEREPTVDVSLLPPVPNPFSEAVRISYELASAAPVAIAVYDASGRLLRFLEDGTRSAGRHEIVWDGKDQSGAPVARGICFVRLSGEAGEHSQRMMVLR